MNNVSCFSTFVSFQKKNRKTSLASLLTQRARRVCACSLTQDFALNGCPEDDFWLLHHDREDSAIVIVNRFAVLGTF